MALNELNVDRRVEGGSDGLGGLGGLFLDNFDPRSGYGSRV